MSATIEASRPSNRIDWEAEIALPKSFPNMVLQRRGPKTGDLTIFLTGATGYLGRHLLASLIKDDRVTHIVVLLHSVADIGTSIHRRDKVSFVEGDISLPNLHLSESLFRNLTETVDVVVHCAANRSFWDNYEVLRLVNLESVKELARLTAKHALPLHFMSSGAVTLYANGITPPTDGSNGYVGTKWAAEEFLHRASVEFGMPVYIHRPTTMQQAFEDTTHRDDVLKQLIECGNKLGARPNFDDICGSVDVIPIEIIVRSIHQSIISSTSFSSIDGGLVQILNYEANLRVLVKDFAMDAKSNEKLHKLPSMPILEWFGRAKRTGFGYFITAQDLEMGTKDGMLVSKR
ncbi:hypothetical protein QQS21_001454 [Conoideocrella luteorostrata]|uniref:Thioester reductase (TE) domain-containing protein n=1 Tax=Conoideocrella luteorostrata TaxID=1105319 RepID=A0AAJ0CWY3_9HYPO|nr:hypothetical protein QQS21_001454 [Conoideocrella luteorostrata]